MFAFRNNFVAMFYPKSNEHYVLIVFCILSTNMLKKLQINLNVIMRLTLKDAFGLLRIRPSKTQMIS